VDVHKTFKLGFEVANNFKLTGYYISNKSPTLLAKAKDILQRLHEITAKQQ